MHRFLRGLGQTLITAGVVILLFCVYELYFTGLETAREQKRLERTIRDVWDTGRGDYPTAADAAVPEIALGEGVAIIRVPRWGRDHYDVVVEGVRVSDLKKGPGHYPASQLPGQVGNFAVAGHRTTYGAPFGRLGELRERDPIVVETATTWFTYAVTSVEVVDPTDTGVVFPVPRQRGARPTKALLTLTTCHPKYSARERLIVFAELTTTTKKAPGVLPPALEG